jgi:cytochrome c5
MVSFVYAQGDAPPTQRIKKIYDTYCYVCHGTGWQGAPMTGNAAEWQPRIEKGWDVVLKSAQVGLNGMPPKGTCEECSAADFRAVIEMMIKE